jgi:hypothetical protein
MKKYGKKGNGISPSEVIWEAITGNRDAVAAKGGLSGLVVAEL